MALSDNYLRIPLELIDVPSDRQRRSVNVEDLKLSIKLRGVIQPIVVERSKEVSDRFVLVAGGRRLTASRENNLPDIPSRMASDLSSTERQILELEENVKRQDLSWQDEALAIQRIHLLYVGMNPLNWTQLKTSEEIGMSFGNVSLSLRVAEELSKGNEHVINAAGLRAAYNLIARRDDRAVADAMNDLLSEPPSEQRVINSASAITEPLVTRVYDLVNTFNDSQSIMEFDFHEFAKSYSGQPFNFLHCDFPYGINHQDSDQGNRSGTNETYSDSSETYWQLCHTLCDNIDRIIAPSAHIIFWLSSNIERQYETIQFFRKNSDLEFKTIPLIWHKTDNRGILPDPKRGPRQVFESALLASRGDRLIIRAVSNTYGSPTTKEIHQSEKPEPMLRFFFQMLVDENTRLLDPTCGSGSALRAAESLGAKEVVGLEINKDFVAGARIKLRQFRTLRSVHD